MSVQLTTKVIQQKSFSRKGMLVNFEECSLSDHVSDHALDVLQGVIEKYKLFPSINVIFTLNAAIAVIPRCKQFIPLGESGRPLRMKKDDAIYFIEIEGLRWFEFATDELRICFDYSYFTTGEVSINE